MVKILDGTYEGIELQLIAPDKRNLKAQTVIKKGLFGDNKKVRKQKEELEKQLTIKGKIQFIIVQNELNGNSMCMIMFTSKYNEKILINLADLVYKNGGTFQYDEVNSVTYISNYNVNVNWQLKDIYCDVYIKSGNKKLFKRINSIAFKDNPELNRKANKKDNKLENALEFIDTGLDIIETVGDIIDLFN